MKKNIILMVLFFLLNIKLSAQGSQIISHILTSDNLYYVGSLKESSGSVYQKLKIEIFGGLFTTSALASDTYSINTRNENIINMERTGGTSHDGYDLKVYKNGTQFDFVIHINKNYISLFVQSWLINGSLDQITPITPINIVKYDSTGKTDVTSTFPKRVISATDAYGNIGIGTLAPQAKLDVNGKAKISEALIVGQQIHPSNPGVIDRLTITPYRHTGGPWVFKSRDTSATAFFDFYYGVNQLMTFRHDKRVGILTDNPQYALDVNGKIHAQEVLIDLNFPLADYVFKPDYKLMPLNELEQFVQTNSHLPEIPSAEEVAEKGLSIGEMQNKLLQKIEELTLYIIQQDKRIQELEKSQQNK